MPMHDNTSHNAYYVRTAWQALHRGARRLARQLVSCMSEPIDFDGEWYGWRLRGRHLVSPTGQRITRERLDGLLFRDDLELRRAGFVSRRKAEAGKNGQQYGPRVKVVIIEMAEFRARGMLAG